MIIFKQRKIPNCGGKDIDFHYELLEETRKEIKNMRFFNEAVEINEEEYEIIHDYDEAYNNAFLREYEYGELEGELWSGILEENEAEPRGDDLWT